jgi:hypothetical protein
MSLIEMLSKIQTIFIDTAPIIYFIEGHTDFGPTSKKSGRKQLGAKWVTTILRGKRIKGWR